MCRKTVTSLLLWILTLAGDSAWAKPPTLSGPEAAPAYIQAEGVDRHNLPTAPPFSTCRMYPFRHPAPASNFSNRSRTTSDQHRPETHHSVCSQTSFPESVTAGCFGAS
jgi:hypothetical protein